MIKKIGLLLAFGLTGLSASDFTVEDGEIETTTQIMGVAGDVGIIENGGSLILTLDFTPGVNAFNQNQQIFNEGLIVTTGQNSNGIVGSSIGQRITNSGLIRTTGNGGIGIFSEGQNGSILNTGSIVTELGEGSVFKTQSLFR